EGRMYSTVSGELLAAGTDLRALLCRQVVSPVRFTEAARAAAVEVDLWLEVGPGRVLSGLISESSAAPAVALDSGGGSVAGLLTALGIAHALGAPLRARALVEGRFFRPFDLDWRPRFFANPCEQAPLPETDESPAARPRDPGPKLPPGSGSA